MIKIIRYWFWKRHARKAVQDGLTSTCAVCDDPIIPGDFIGIGTDTDGKKVHVHAGYHFSISNMSAFCETGAIGSAVWDGRNVVGIGESLAAKAMRTGQPQIM